MYICNYIEVDWSIWESLAQILHQSSKTELIEGTTQQNVSGSNAYCFISKIIFLHYTFVN